MEVNKKVCLQSCDGELYEVDNDVVGMCATVKNMLKGKTAFRNSLGGQFSIDGSYVILKKEGRVLASLTKNNDEEAIVTLPDVKSSTLEKVIEYCKFHNGASATSSTVTEREKKAWDMEFVQVKQSVLCELASASYYLDIKPLVNLTSRAIATQISATSLATRCRLQRKFNRKKQDEKDVKPPQTEDDSRSVEELLEFIDGGGGGGRRGIIQSASAGSQTSSSKKKANKKANKKKKKKQDAKDAEETDEGLEDDLSSTLSEDLTSSIRESLTMLEKSDDDSDSPSPSNERNSSGTGTPDNEESWSEDDLDPKQRADLDKEVEEFRQRLESMSTENGSQKPKISLPASASSMLSSIGVGVH